MSNLNPDVSHKSVTTTLRGILEKWTTQLYTCLPGVIDSFEPTTRRVRVQPALNTLYTDGTYGPRPLLVNVPVMTPFADQFIMTLPLKAGNPVLLLFSMFGMTAFKKSFAVSDPHATRLFDQSDAVALPGFGSLTIEPATVTGLALQTLDGTKSIRLERDRIELHAHPTALVGKVRVIMREDRLELRVGTSLLEVTETGIEITSGTLTHNGVNIGDTHTHGGVDPGTASTTGPQ